jgi:hypothetical protein
MSTKFVVQGGSRLSRVSLRVPLAVLTSLAIAGIMTASCSSSGDEAKSALRKACNGMFVVKSGVVVGWNSKPRSIERDVLLARRA